jgi:outer membrane protein
MKRVQTLLMGAACALSLTGAHAEVGVSTGPIVLTLNQSIALAINGATEILKAKNSLDFTGTQLMQTYLQFLPNLEAGAGYAWQSGRVYYTQTAPTTVATTNRSVNYSLTSTLNLFNGFGDVASLRSGRERNAAADMSLYRARQQIILDVTQAYLQVLLDRDIVSFAGSNLKSSRQRETLLEGQTQVGSKSLADLYRQQAQTSADELFFIQSQNRARDDQILLLRRLRVDLMKTYDLADIAIDTPTAKDPYPVTDEQKLLLSAIEARADLRAFRASAEAAQWDVTTARSGYFPQLNLFADAAGTGELLDRQIVNGVNQLPLPQEPLGKQLGEHGVYTAGVNLNWGLFDRYLTRTAVSRADVNARDAQIDYEDLKLQVEGEVQQTIGDYHAALQQLESARRGVQSAQESYDAVQERYKVGASSIVDLLTAQSALVQAQSSDAQARIGFMLQEKTMENVLGRTDVASAH